MREKVALFLRSFCPAFARRVSHEGATSSDKNKASRTSNAQRPTSNIERCRSYAAGAACRPGFRLGTLDHRLISVSCTRSYSTTARLERMWGLAAEVKCCQEMSRAARRRHGQPPNVTIHGWTGQSNAERGSRNAEQETPQNAEPYFAKASKGRRGTNNSDSAASQPADRKHAK